MVYHVGRPEMLDGNKFFALTGMPILKTARTSRPLAVWLPEPLTVATTIEKSFTISGRSAPCAVAAAFPARLPCSWLILLVEIRN